MTPRTTNVAAAADPATTIHARALLVWLTIRTWSARKYDRKVSTETNARYAASADAGRYNKFLLPGDNAAYKQLMALATSVRSEHYAHTLAWSDEGWRLLPTANYTMYMDWLRKQQQTFRAALDTFAADYPMMRSRAKTALGPIYRDEDYPSVADLRSRFELTAAVSPLPIVGDVRVDLDAQQIADIEANIVNRQDAAIRIAVSDAWQRLTDVVAKIQKRLSQPDAIFRDSLIVNARELCESLTRLNVTNDPQLEAMRVKVERQLTNVDPDVLRDNTKIRSDVAAKADAILSQMSELFAVA